MSGAVEKLKKILSGDSKEDEYKSSDIIQEIEKRVLIPVSASELQDNRQFFRIQYEHEVKSKSL